MTLTRIRRLARADRQIERLNQLLEQHEALGWMSQTLIEDLMRENQQIRLEALRAQQGLVAGWLIATEKPEVDMRPELAQLETVLAHGIAQLEEHIL